jgi:hypothetical protein
MNPTTISLFSLGLIVVGTLVGLTLNRRLPEHHLTNGSRDAIKVGAGMVSMMTALVLGLLVSSAKSRFESANEAVCGGSARIIVMDRLLQSYGPGAAEIREDLHKGAALAAEMLWPKKPGSIEAFKIFESARPMEKMVERIRALKPENPVQVSLQSQLLNLGNEQVRERWMQIEMAQAEAPPAMLITMLFWLTMLFVSFGLLAPRNPTVVVVLFVGALSVSSAIFLILELGHPMDGIIKVSGQPMFKALEILNR